MSESNVMAVRLTEDFAAPQWGENALVSYTHEQATIHITQQNALLAIQKAGRKLAVQGLKNLNLIGSEWSLERIWAFYQGSQAPKDQVTMSWPCLSTQESEELEARIQAISWMRQIINESGEQVGPRQLATKAALFIQSVAPADTVTYRLVQEKDLLNEGWVGTYHVGRGSDRTSTMLQLDYNPTKNADTAVDTAIVGKGITFDSGGYSLKQSSFMDAMKADMGGAAMAVAALALAIRRGLDKRVTLILCCAENMVSGTAFKLGDILTYKNGKTVEVMNTDAEGRLVLADGLIYADEQQPQRIIDCATLTGAAKVALGNDYHALFSFDQQIIEDMLACAQAENEKFWQLPLDETHRGGLPSHFADLSNVASGQYAPGASTAAGFLSHFVNNYQHNWLHIDCSATYRKTASDYWAVGATGIGVKTLARLLMHAC